MFLIEDKIEILYYRKKELLQVRWVTSPKNDLIADSVCLLVLQIKENPTPQLVSMMSIAADQRQDQVFTAKLGTVLESHFDEVVADFEGQPGHFMVAHPERGRMVIDSVAKRIVQADDEDMAEFGVEILASLQEAALPYTVSQF